MSWSAAGKWGARIGSKFIPGLGWAFAAYEAYQLGTAAWQMGASYFSGPATDALATLEEQVQVQVVGHPTARKKDLALLALAVAFGRCPRRDSLSAVPLPGELSLVTSLYAKEVAVQLTYRYNGVVAKFLTGGIKEGRVSFEDPKTDVIMGRNWPVALAIAGVNPYADKLIVADRNPLEPIDPAAKQNPQPPGDANTRGVYLEQLFTAALSG
jgi:hypothetical protein